jgi:RND superfamily putative drug exporter
MRYGGFVYHARWVVLLSCLALVVVAAIFGATVFGQLKSGGFEDPNSESSRAQVLLDQRLGGSVTDLVLVMRSETLQVTEPAFVAAATEVLGTLQARQEVASVTSYYSTQSLRFLSRDGHETFAAVQLTAQDLTTKQRDYGALRPLMASTILHISIGGNVATTVALRDQASADLKRAEIISFPLVGLLLFLVFAGLVAASLPLLIGAIAILGAFALLRALTGLTDISIFASNVVTVMGLGLAIDYALFIVTRFREELTPDARNVQGALQRTLATAGRTVLFSGLTVTVSLLGLLLFPEGFLRSIALGAIGAVLVAMLAALTLLPAILAIVGRRVDALSIRGPLQRLFSSRRVANAGVRRGAWYRLSQGVMRFPAPVLVLVLGVLVLLGSPFLHASFSTPDARSLPVGREARVAAERIAQDFAQQGASELVIAVRTPGDALSSDNLASLDAYVRAIEALPGVVQTQSLVSVDPARSLADYQRLYAHPGADPRLTAIATRLASGDVTKVTVELQAEEFSAATNATVRQIRALSVPGGLQALVGGATPIQMDLFADLGARLPYALLVMALTIFVLLFLMTGSVVVPVKAIALNMLSLTATFGALVWIFQDGNLQGQLNFQANGSIDGTQTILIFALAFGLSMDYEVFLLSRIREEFAATGDNRAAVAAGLQRTGWLITSAALLFAAVLAAFSTSELVFIKQIGVGLAIALVMDATLVRGLLVPATMRLLGRWNWWAPRPLRWLWQRVGLHEGTTPPDDATSAGMLTAHRDYAHAGSATGRE